MTVIERKKSQSVIAEVLDVRQLSSNTFVLRFERAFDFEPGQYVKVGLSDGTPLREYSVYSSPLDEAFEILVKEVPRPEGRVSPALCHSRPGDLLTVEGPFGHFVLKSSARSLNRFTFTATGTGIAPFHSMVQTWPDLDYQLLHGVSYTCELYEVDHFQADRHISCITREQGGAFHGRVTDYLKTIPIEPFRLFYFCGSSEMIFDAFRILSERGVACERMFAEIYF